MWSEYLFFHLYRCRGFDKSISMPLSEKGNGRVPSPASNLMSWLSIGHVGPGDQESDTTFSQILPLRVVSHPEWWPTRLQALTPLYQYGMEADREWPARHVAVEGWGLRLLDGSDAITWHWHGVHKTGMIVHWICLFFIYFILVSTILFTPVCETKPRCELFL